MNSIKTNISTLDTRFPRQGRIGLFECIAVLALVLFCNGIHTASAVDFNAYSVYGFVWDGSEFETEVDGTGKTWYVQEVGGLRDHDAGLATDDCNYYAENTACGNTDHKPGSEAYPQHWHVFRTNWSSDFGNPTQDWGTIPPISRKEAAKFWSVLIMNEGVVGGTPAKYHHEGTDYNDVDVDGMVSLPSDASFHYNCHGYAFDEDGLSNFKLLLGDSSNGAQNILDEYYTNFTAGAQSMEKDLMFLGTHTNFIENDWGGNNCKAKTISFKYRCSQIFTFMYNSPGRTHNQTFFGTTPEYWTRD